MIYEPGDLPAVVQEQLFQPTSNWEYIPRDKIKPLSLGFLTLFSKKRVFFLYADQELYRRSLYSRYIHKIINYLKVQEGKE